MFSFYGRGFDLMISRREKQQPEHRAVSAPAVLFSSDNISLCPSLLFPVRPSLCCSERFVLPIAQPRKKVTSVNSNLWGREGKG